MAEIARIVTVDGPPAAGKTTAATLLAKKLGFIHMDSGAVFRTLTLNCMENGVDFKNENDICSTLYDVKITARPDGIYLNGKNVSTQIRDVSVTQNVCNISYLPEVRKFVMDFQKGLAKNCNGIVSDGRKVGTEVFPEAQAKFFLTAELRTRVYRRYLQFRETDPDIYCCDVARDLMEREKKEIKNGILLVPKNPIILDNTHLDISQTLSKMIDLLAERNFFSKK